MPYSRPGYMAYATRETGDPAISHGDPVVKNGVVGVVVKQKANSWQQGFVGLRAVAVNEDYAIISKGIVQVPNDGIEAADFGDPVYIDPATGDLGTTGTTPFGRVVEVEGERSTPTGFVRIDLDKKDNV